MRTGQHFVYREQQPAAGNRATLLGAARGTRCDEAQRGMQTIDLAELATVTGGADDFGRCGPASGWKFLGDVRTAECAAHDGAVRGAQANGTSKIMAHIQALPLLPAAVGSYVKKQLGF
jgi:hypothetical protein